MSRRRRRRRRAGLGSVVLDVARAAARLPWWGALIFGLCAYVLLGVLFSGYVEFLISKQHGSPFGEVAQARLGPILRALNWVAIACLVSGVFFALRNAFVQRSVSTGESWWIAMASRILGRNLDS